MACLPFLDAINVAEVDLLLVTQCVWPRPPAGRPGDGLTRAAVALKLPH
jgi:hypothetical protein